MPVKQTKDGRYFVQYRVHDKKSPTKEYFGRGPDGKRAAQVRDAEVNLARKRHQRVVKPAGVYFDQLAQAYLKDLRARGKTEKHGQELAKLLNNHLLPMLCHRPVDQLDYDDIMRVAERYADRSQATRNRYLGYLRAIFRFGVDQEITTHNPMKKWRKGREPRRKMLLTVDDLKRIYENAAPHLQWAIEVEWHLGTRPGVSELLALRWSDIDFDNGTVHVAGTKTKGSDRIVHINAAFRSRLLEMRDQAQTEYVVEYKGQPVKKFRRSFKTACKNAGINYDVRMYDIRHLFISVSLAGGADLKAVSETVGHASTKMTADVYYHSLEGEKQKAADNIPDIRPPDKARKVLKIR